MCEILGQPLEVGSRRELFVDYYLIALMRGAELRLQSPQKAEVSILFDQPWEGPFSGCVTVLHDGVRYRMYYRGWPEVTEPSSLGCTCCALSDDGIQWMKPELDIYEVAGTRRNNVVLFDDPSGTHNFAPFIDTRPGVPEEERFKAVGGTARYGGPCAYVSADGFHWRKMREEPILASEVFAFDSQNVAFWSESEGCYALYFRTWHPLPGAPAKHGVRWVSRSTSEDFLHWSAPVEMETRHGPEEALAPYEELYTQQTHPYFRAPHIYIALAARFQPGRRVLTEAQARAIGVHEKYYGDCSDAVLLTSRGGNRYERTFLESFIRPGLGYTHWVSRANYPACGVVPAGSEAMSLYVHRDYAQATAHVRRFTLRTDGFASVHAPYAGGEVLTRPLLFAGSELEINYSTSAAGFVRVEIQEPDGRPIPGYGLAEAEEIIGDEIARVVHWQSGVNIASLAGRPVRLRFVLKDADLYSLRFR